MHTDKVNDRYKQMCLLSTSTAKECLFCLYRHHQRHTTTINISELHMVRQNRDIQKEKKKNV